MNNRMKKYVNLKWGLALCIFLLLSYPLIIENFKPIEVGNNEFSLFPKWSTKLSDKVLEISASDSGIIFVRSAYSLNALDVSMGTLLWKFYLGGQVITDPAISADGIVYIADKKYVYALNENHGNVVWQQELTEPDGGSVLDVSDKLILVNQNSYDIRAYDAKTGEFLWTTPTGRGPRQAYIDDNNKIVYILDDGIKAVDIATSKLIWHAVDDGKGFYENGIMYRTSEKGTNAFNVQIQSYQWETQLNISAPYMTNFASGKDQFAIADHGHIYVIQKTDGTIIWERNFSEMPANFSVIGDTLFAKDSFNQIIYLFDMKTGHEMGALRISIPSLFAVDSQNITSTDDMLIFSKGKSIYAYGN
jgi:outer membrane protein assembly factor BamB